jgi:hypothetical protein
VHGIIPEGKTRSRGIDLAPTFKVEVKERLELGVYSTSVCPMVKVVVMWM